MNNRFDDSKGLLPDYQYENKFLGVCIAVVIDNKDPDKQGKVKVKIPWLKNQESDDEDFTTDWIRIRYLYAGKERGQLWVPEIDDEVLLAFEHGNIRIPYVVGRLWGGIDIPMTSAPTDGNDLKWIQTRVGHQLIFSETGPEEVVFHDAPLKNHIKVQKDEDYCFFEADTGKINIFAKQGQVNIEAKEINRQSSEDTNYTIGQVYDVKVDVDAMWDIATLWDITVGVDLYITSPVRICDPTTTLDVKATIAKVEIEKYAAEVGETKIQYGMVTKDLASGGKSLKVQGKMEWVAGMMDMAAVQFGMEASAKAEFTGDAMLQVQSMKGASILGDGKLDVQGAMIIMKGSAVWCAG